MYRFPPVSLHPLCHIESNPAMSQRSPNILPKLTVSVNRRRRLASSLRGLGGFTLIELLVVISVALVFASLLLTYGFKSVDRANEAKCLANLRQIGVATALCLADSDNSFPQQGGGPVGPPGRTWWGDLIPYLSWSAEKNFASPTTAEGTIGHCPSHRENPGSFSYVPNINVIRTPDMSALKMSAVSKPSQVVYVWEIFTVSWWPNSGSSSIRGRAPFYGSRTKTGFLGTHADKINYLFLGGNVAPYSVNEHMPETVTFSPTL